MRNIIHANANQIKSLSPLYSRGGNLRTWVNLHTSYLLLLTKYSLSVLCKTHNTTHTYSNDGPPRLLDESEQELRVADRQKLFKYYCTERQSILQKRNDDREFRNEAKLKQLQQAETWQVMI